MAPTLAPPDVFTIADLREQLARYEAALVDAGLKPNTVTTYVQHPERFLSWLSGDYSPRPRGDDEAPAAGEDRAPLVAGGHSKYQALADHLLGEDARVVHMTFEAVEQVLGFELPASARRYPAWWANERGGSHSHARGWSAAGRRTERVDLQVGKVVFVLDRPSDVGPFDFVGVGRSTELRARDEDGALAGFGDDAFGDR